MTTTILDLWPGLEFVDTIPPVTILRQQATFIGQKTRNLVEGEIITTSSANGMFRHSFFLLAPALDNYRYELLYIEHSIALYPLNIYVESELSNTCINESAFITALGGIFASYRTMQAISSLVTQSKA